MLRHRVPSAVVMVAGLLLLMWADAWAARPETLGGWGLPGMVMLVFLLVPAAWLASREIGVLFHAVGMGRVQGGMFLGALAGLLLSISPTAEDVLKQSFRVSGLMAVLVPGLVAVVTGWMVLAALRQQHNAKGAMHLIAAMAVGLVFLGLTTGAWFWVRVLLGPVGLAGAVMVIKCCDIGAYFTGRFMGKHKLIVWLSPGKTWEGLVGGMTVSALVAVGLCVLADGYATEGTGLSGVEGVGAWPWWYAALSGALLGYVGQLGDLFASAMKRDAGVKDFAQTIPGFGGVMDVIDSLLLAGPVVVALVVVGRALG